MLRIPLHAPGWVLAVFRPRPAAATPARPRTAPEPFVEHDPRKRDHALSRNVTPVHLLAAGGRGEIFPIPR